MKRFLLCLLGKHPMLATLIPGFAAMTSTQDWLTLKYCPFCMRVVVEKVEDCE